jgi:prepilin-type N-terminal cleavage/methylation domain-containing protein
MKCETCQPMPKAAAGPPQPGGGGKPETGNVKPQTSNLKPQPTSGFTLLELMAAMVILTIAMAIAFEAFSGTIRGWKRGSEVVEGIKHGDFAMTQLATALNSTIFFTSPRKNYAFKMERGTVSGLPADSISFVTASSAFMPEGSPLRHGPHRIELYIDDDEEGNPALFSLAFPAIADIEEAEDEYDAEPHLISRAVQGMEVLLYNKELEDWSDDEWEKGNSIPDMVKLTLFVASEEEDEEPIEFSRVIEIPVAASVSAKLTGPTQQKKKK